MTARSNRPDPPTPRPLSNWSIAAGALVVLAVAAVVWFVLLRRYGSQGAQVQLDAIRTAGTLVIGTGGAVALLLTARRQRYTELALVHTDRDATERRITELYTKAADQLGSEKAPVRLAGLYALERLAENTPDQQQTIVDVICAYLRMPYRPPEDQPPTEDAPADVRTCYENRRQEQQVRLTAQNILTRNLRIIGQHRRRVWHGAPPNILAWPGIEINLAGALLHEFSLTNCQLGYANFAHAQFTGEAHFEAAQFTGEAHFEGARFAREAHYESAWFAREASYEGAQFTGVALFRDARFTDGAKFGGAQFADQADFRRAQFTAEARFEGTQFTGVAHFWGARFTDLAYFKGAQFNDGALFRDARFSDDAIFEGAQFNGEADFREVHFLAGGTGLFRFQGAWVTSTARPGTVWPPGWTTRPAKPDKGEDPDFLYLTRA